MKNGVIKDLKVHQEVVEMLVSFIHSIGLYVNDLTYSTQKGKMGNIEYLALVSRNPKEKSYHIKDIIKASHEI